MPLKPSCAGTNWPSAEKREVKRRRDITASRGAPAMERVFVQRAFLGLLLISGAHTYEERGGFYLKNLACNCYVGEVNGGIQPVPVGSAVLFRTETYMDHGLSKVARVLDESGRAMDFRKPNHVKLLRQESTVTQDAKILSFTDGMISITNGKKCLKYKRAKNVFGRGPCESKTNAAVFKKVSPADREGEIRNRDRKETVQGQMSRERSQYKEAHPQDLDGDFYSWRKLPLRKPPKLRIARHYHAHAYGNEGENSATYFFSGRHPASINEKLPYFHDHANDADNIVRTRQVHPSFAPPE